MATDLPHQTHQPSQKGSTEAQQESLLPHNSDRLWTNYIEMEVSEMLNFSYKLALMSGYMYTKFHPVIQGKGGTLRGEAALPPPQ